MKDLYLIGEVAALLGISAQTLRFYSNQGLIQPKYIDDQTGYRYYSYDQFHKIDRIKYLQSLGMSLAEIRAALQSGRISDLLPVLKLHRDKMAGELNALARSLDTLDWYIDYYSYPRDNYFPNIPFKKKYPDRHLLAVPMQKGEPLFGPGGYRLAELKNKPDFRNLPFLRQHGYLLGYKALLDGRIEPEHYFVYLKNYIPSEEEAVKTLPAGEYLCFHGRLLVSEWAPELIISLLKTLPDNPRLVVADEYEDNLNDFSRDIYEIQVLLKPGAEPGSSSSGQQTEKQPA